MSDALIERVGISGNRRRLVDSLSSPFISRNARPNMISEIERCLINFNRQSNTFNLYAIVIVELRDDISKRDNER